MRIQFFVAIAVCGLVEISQSPMALAGSSASQSEADVFPGVEGGGWNGSWLSTAVFHDSTYLGPKDIWPSGWLEDVITVTQEDPLGSDSYHLNITHVDKREGVQMITLTRAMAIDRQQPYEVTLKVRLDDLAGPTPRGDSFYLRLAATSGEIGKTGTSGNTSWWIQVNAEHDREWQFVTNNAGGASDEFRFVSSGIKLEVGTTYHFTVKVSPDTRQYSVTLSDGQNTVTKSGLGFRNSSQDAPMSYLTVGSVAQRQVDLSYSISDVAVKEIHP